MPRCTMKLCKNFGRELLPEEIEFAPQLGINVCSECYSAIEEDADQSTPVQSNIFPPAILPLPQEDNLEGVIAITDAPVQQNSAVEIDMTPDDDLLGWEGTISFDNNPPQQKPTEDNVTGVVPSELLIDDGSFVDEFSLVGESNEFPVLEVWQGQQVRAKYEIKKDIFMIGRASSKSSDLPDIDFSKYADGKTVSRTHARIIQYGGKYYVEDLNSSSHTWCNDDLLEPNQPHILNHNDSITIGDAAELVFLMPGSST
jgi:hypothetical protein